MDEVAHSHPPRLLVVEDDAAIQQLYADVFADAGYQSVFVESGDAALAQLRAASFDLVILDVALPDTDGYTVCDAIRRAAQPAVPVLMVSAGRDPRGVLRAFAVGADDYLRKPFRVSELLAQVRSQLNRPHVTAHASAIG